MNTMYIPLTRGELEKIMEILKKGDRVELIPAKDRIKIIHITRKEIKE